MQGQLQGAGLGEMQGEDCGLKGVPMGRLGESSLMHLVPNLGCRVYDVSL